jgi:hypothetical protein
VGVRTVPAIDAARRFLAEDLEAQLAGHGVSVTVYE